MVSFRSSSSCALVAIQAILMKMTMTMTHSNAAAALEGVEACAGVEAYTAMNDGKKLVTMDMKTGETKRIVTLTKGGNIHSLAYNHISNKLLGLRRGGARGGSSRLATVNPRTGKVILGPKVMIESRDTANGTSEPLAGQLQGLTMDDTGSTLYSYSTTDKILYSIHPTSGLARSRLPTTSFVIGTIKDLAYYKGHVYATTGTVLYELDPTARGNNGNQGVVAAHEFFNIHDIKEDVIAIFFAPKTAKKGATADGVMYGITAATARRDARIYGIAKNSGRVTRQVYVRSGLFQRSMSGGALRCILPPPLVCAGMSPNSFQPKVTVVEGLPARKGFFSGLSLPDGSPWCLNHSTYWDVGHQQTGESPWCLINGTWIQPMVAVMDFTDPLNAADPAHPGGRGAIDRHSCAPIDVNQDGMPDIVCVIGANSGEGKGFPELYLTQPDGSIRKVLEHGLQAHPTVRGRLVVPIEGVKKAGGGKPQQLVFEGSNGIPRRDGRPNTHFMFRTIPRPPYFVQIKGGPWQTYLNAPCAVAADVTHDGIQDLLLCNSNGPAVIFQQLQSGSWSQVSLPNNNAPLLGQWRNLRVGDVTQDGLPDLVVVTTSKDQATLVVFQGKETSPFFAFHNPYYTHIFNHAAPDVELLDVNRDGHLDIYVVQNNEFNENQYCALKDVRALWNGAFKPPDDWVPPKDRARDVLLLNAAHRCIGKDKRFLTVTMQHALPGCGFRVQRFGNPQTMTLAHGEPNRPGFNVILGW